MMLDRVAKELVYFVLTMTMTLIYYLILSYLILRIAKERCRCVCC